jgi:hypothetical protein
MNNQPTEQNEDKLEAALGALAAGTPLEQALGDDEWLRPLLDVATEVSALGPAIPLPPPTASLQRLLTYGEELTAPPSRPDWRARLAHLLSESWDFRLAPGVVVAALTLVLTLGGFSLSVQASLPNQPLYGLKQAGEAFQLSLTQDPAEREQLLTTFNARRQEETRLLLAQGKEGAVAFEGQVEALDEATFTIAGLVAQITPETEISGELTNQARIHLAGVVQPSRGLIALAITVLETPPPPVPTPLPTITPTPLPTATTTPTPRATPTTTPPPPLESGTGPENTDDSPPPEVDGPNDLGDEADDFAEEEAGSDDFADDSHDDFDSGAGDGDTPGNDDNDQDDFDNGDDGGNDDDPAPDDDSDGDKGHGNDPDRCDEENPGQGPGGCSR